MYFFFRGLEITVFLKFEIFPSRQKIQKSDNLVFSEIFEFKNNDK